MSETRAAAFERIAAELGYDFSGEMKIGGNYVPFLIEGNQVHLSGQIPRVGDEIVVTGRAGSEVSLADAQRAAKVCVMRALALLRQALGDLERVRKVLQLNVFVQSAEHFTQHSEVADGARQSCMRCWAWPVCTRARRSASISCRRMRRSS